MAGWPRFTIQTGGAGAAVLERGTVRIRKSELSALVERAIERQHLGQFDTTIDTGTPVDIQSIYIPPEVPVTTIDVNAPSTAPSSGQAGSSALYSLTNLIPGAASVLRSLLPSGSITIGPPGPGPSLPMGYPEASFLGIPWWGWLLVGMGGVGLILLGYSEAKGQGNRP